MIFFKTKNNSLEYTKLQEYKNNIEKLINKDQYISKKEYSDFVNSNKTIYDKLMMMEQESVLESWCKKQKTNYI